MRYRILGPPEVHDGQRPVPIPQGRQRLVLAVVLVHANEVVTRDRLIDAVWADSPPSTALKSLHNVVSAIRKGLGDELVTRDGAYVLHVAQGELDADRFEELARQGAAARERGDPERAAALLREALKLGRSSAGRRAGSGCRSWVRRSWIGRAALRAVWPSGSAPPARGSSTPRPAAASTCGSCGLCSATASP
jgi:DNA-binding SARP family transcriptional activator